MDKSRAGQVARIFVSGEAPSAPATVSACSREIVRVGARLQAETVAGAELDRLGLELERALIRDREVADAVDARVEEQAAEHGDPLGVHRVAVQENEATNIYE